tara:strand:- start:366 stop:959 length:594 start_codon:yes stop_codon:yes gene_type:complete
MAIKPTGIMQPDAAYAILAVGIVPPPLIAHAIIPKRFNNHHLHEMLERRLAKQRSQPSIYQYDRFWLDLSKWEGIPSGSLLALMTPEEQLANPEKAMRLKEHNHRFFEPYLLNFHYYRDMGEIDKNTNMETGRKVNGFGFDAGFYYSSDVTKELCYRFNKMFQYHLKRHNYTYSPHRVRVGTSNNIFIYDGNGFEVR